MKVSIDILQRVYDTFQNGGDTGQGEDDWLDPDAHLHFVNAYDMPLCNWSPEKDAFERCVSLSVTPFHL